MKKIKKRLDISDFCDIISHVVREIPEQHNRISGVFGAEVPPVPIPNTVVKLCSAENTWLEAARENRSMPEQKTTQQSGFFFLITI